MDLITKLTDSRLGKIYDNLSAVLHTNSLRTALKERDDYKEGGQAYWDGIVALRAERDAVLVALRRLSAHAKSATLYIGEGDEEGDTEAKHKLKQSADIADEVIAKMETP